jgi:hypothetical protein
MHLCKPNYIFLYSTPQIFTQFTFLMSMAFFMFVYIFMIVSTVQNIQLFMLLVIYMFHTCKYVSFVSPL